MFWTVYNLLVLLVAIAACIERPRPNRPSRQVVEPITLLIGEQEQRGWLVNLGAEGARVSGPSGLSIGEKGLLRLPTIGDIDAHILASTQDGYRMKLSPTLRQRDQIIERLHTVQAVPGVDKGDIGLMIRELARALTR
jgi:cellulose synthase (UDP-forming)